MKNLEKGFFIFWIKNYKVSFLLVFLIIFAGIFSLLNIPKESSPDIKIGIISISTIYPGVNPNDVDALITEKIEKEIKDIEGIKKINSSSSVGLSSVTVELENGVITRNILSDIKDKIDKINFPEDTEDSLIQEIGTRNKLLFDILLYNKEKNDFRLNKLARIFKNELEGKYGITSIKIGGTDIRRVGGSSSNANDYKIKVLLSKEKLEFLGLSISDISRKIRGENKNTPIGNYTIGNLNYDFRFDSELSSIEELRNITIKGDGISKVRLGDVATFKKEYDSSKIQSLGFYNNPGNNYIALSINKSPGTSVFKTSSSAKKAIGELVSSDIRFKNIGLKYTNDISNIIIDDYKVLGKTGIQTLVLVFLTILIFVGFRESLIASLLLPLSFLITFVVLDSIGYTLNFLTNFSLILTLGIAIDTIIVIIEGASERQSLGYGRKYAILLALKDLKSPLISGTLTTLVVFLPMIFLPGIIGKFLSYIPITVFSTLLAALILSLTISGALFLKLSKKKNSFHKNLGFEKRLSSEEKIFLESQRENKKLEETSEGFRAKMLSTLSLFYYKALKKFLSSRKQRLLSIFVPIILLIFSFVFLAQKIGFTVFPPTDEGYITILIETKTGTDKKVLEKYLKPIDKSLSKIPELNVYTSVISGNNLDVNVTLLKKTERGKKGMRDVFEVEKIISNDLEYLVSDGIKLSVKTLKGGPPVGSPVGIKLITNNNKKINVLRDVAYDFEEFLKKIKGTKNVGISSSDSSGQFIFKFDKEKLAFVGLSSSEVLDQVYFYTSGIKSSSIKSELENNDIVLQVKDFEDNFSPEDLENLVLDTRIGKIRVGDYVDFSFEKSFSSINREDGRIKISVNSDLEDGVVPTSVQPKLIDFAKNYNYPAGISFIAGGETQENKELIISTFRSFFIALFLIFSILVLQFNSYSQPIIILYSIVLALLGVNIGLFLTGNPYSMPFAIGFIALTGIVVNDAIILIDRINKNIERMRSNITKNLLLDDYVEAILEGGKNRLQPIIVTTLTTIFGVLPLAIRDEFWAGLGFTIIFGLFVGSSMTLFVIPALYYGICLRRKMK